MKTKLLLSFLAITLALTPCAIAQETIWEMANSDQYGKKAGGMFGRGLLNAASCFVDIAAQTVEGTKKGPPIVGTVAGIGGGAACTVLRAASGILDVATFWVPGFHGIPVSKSYTNCLVMDETPVQAAPVAYQQPAPTYAAPVVTTKSAPVAQQKSSQDVMQYVKK